MKKLLEMTAAISMVCALAACGSSTQPADGTATEAPAESAAADVQEDGQNPVMNVVGVYGAGRAMMNVEAGEGSTAKITVYWPGSAAEHGEWTMSGEMDSTTGVMEYADCTKKVIVYKTDGSIESETTAYENGKGRINFDLSAGTLTWEDDEENIADGTVFTYSAFAAPADAQTFLGVWGKDRVSAEVTGCEEEPGTYDVMIHWGSSASEYTQWTYHCEYDGENLVCSGKGTKTNVVMKENGEAESEEEVYNDGSAVFSINENGCMTWNDEKEDAGADLELEYSGPVTE